MKTKFKVEAGDEKYPEDRWYAWFKDEWIPILGEDRSRSCAGWPALFIHVDWHRSVLRAAKGRPVSGLHRGRLSWRDPFAVLLLANSVVAEARPFPDLTIETIELTIEHSIELPTKEAIYANQVWCGTLLGFDELATCVERTQRIEHFSKARGQIHGIRSATPTTVAEHKQLHDAVKHVQSDARTAERYLRIGTGIET